MPLDVNVFDKLKTFQDYQQAEEAFQLKKRLAAQNLALSQSDSKLPAAMQLANEYQKRVAAGDIEGANLLSQFAKTIDKGVATDASGVFQPLPGYGAAIGSIEGAKSGAKQNAKNASDLGYAAPIEKAKQQGRGEISPIDAKNTGKQQVSDVLSELGGYYEQLDAQGAAVNTEKSALENTKAYFGNTIVGQEAGKMGGTKSQSVRNSISMTRPRLINAIRNATGMSAKAMDSNAELQFYLQQATDPTLDVQANKAALGNLDKAYGLGLGSAQGDINSPQGGAVNMESPAPPGGILYGTSGGKPVYKMPNGSFVMEQ